MRDWDSLDVTLVLIASTFPMGVVALIVWILVGQ